jgi:hypothetical protein
MKTLCTWPQFRFAIALTAMLALTVFGLLHLPLRGTKPWQ